MIGRFLGADVPATGFSLGFERLIDLVDLGDDDRSDMVALVHDAAIDLGTLMTLKTVLVAEGARVRLLKRPKNLKAALDQLAAEGCTRFALVAADAPAEVAALDWRRLDSAP
jgi:histidyl-tRNA synthetase